MFCKWLNVSPTIFKSDLFYTDKKSYPIFFTHQMFLPDSFHSKKRFHILWKKMFWNTIRKTQRFKQVWNNILELKTCHYVESVRIWSCSGPYFPAFGLHTERFGVYLGIQSECGKIRTRKTPITDTFQAVYLQSP